jgi:hypothetical protein
MVQTVMAFTTILSFAFLVMVPTAQGAKTCYRDGKPEECIFTTKSSKSNSSERIGAPAKTTTIKRSKSNRRAAGQENDKATYRPGIGQPGNVGR